MRGTSGIVGGGELGCFDLSRSQVPSLRGASPSDRSILQAFPCKPILAKEITESYRLLEFSCLCCDGALWALVPKSTKLFLCPDNTLIGMHVLQVVAFTF